MSDPRQFPQRNGDQAAGGSGSAPVEARGRVDGDGQRPSDFRGAIRRPAPSRLTAAAGGAQAGRDGQGGGRPETPAPRVQDHGPTDARLSQGVARAGGNGRSPAGPPNSQPGGTGAGLGGARPAAGGGRTPRQAAIADRAEKLTIKAYDSDHRPTWCPGCGDFGILTALKKALVDLEIWPHEVMVVSGIGCGSKLPDYLNANGFMTIHGRPLAVATGIKLANPKLHVIVVHGDGDGYGIGGNHWLHTMRRNINLTDIIENNQIYALTKGQYSPTSERGFKTTTSPTGAPEDPVLPTRIAFAAGATFIARAFAGQPNQMAAIFAAAIRHRGYALVDVLQPCVTFNKLNTYDWYAERAYAVEEEGHDPTDPEAAWRKCNEWGERIPIGILWRNEAVPPYEERVPGLAQQPPIVERPLDELGPEGLERLKEAFL